MKIAIATVKVPFITGGAEILVEMLQKELIKAGHQADIVAIPFKWYPVSTLLDCMLMGRMQDLSEVNGEKIDVVIATKFPAYYVKHPRKVIWLMHQHRQAYDLWGTAYGDLHKLPEGEWIRKMIKTHDEKYLGEARAVYTIAQNSANRLLKYNQINSETLYHPPLHHEKMRCEGFGDYIFYASRIDAMKRQRLLAEAARYVKSDVKFIIAGAGVQSEIDYIGSYIKKHKLADKITLTGFISEEEKLAYYANCLGVYFGAYDEDYGYITLESFFSKKPVIIHPDAGGPLEFVIDGENGYVVDPDPRLLAEKIDYWFENRTAAREMGDKGYTSVLQKNIDWQHVLDKLLG